MTAVPDSLQNVFFSTGQIANLVDYTPWYIINNLRRFRNGLAHPSRAVRYIIRFFAGSEQVSNRPENFFDACCCRSTSF